MPRIFERTQWPVGHGGFHTGRLIGHSQTLFSYFYDCGSHAPAASKAVALIRVELSSRHFQAGVISHFDHDHFAAVSHSAPAVLYLSEVKLTILSLRDISPNLIRQRMPAKKDKVIQWSIAMVADQWHALANLKT